jgi:hypothetical protein
MKDLLPLRGRHGWIFSADVVALARTTSTLVSGDRCATRLIR